MEVFLYGIEISVAGTLPPYKLPYYTDISELEVGHIGKHKRARAYTVINITIASKIEVLWKWLSGERPTTC